MRCSVGKKPLLRGGLLWQRRIGPDGWDWTWRHGIVNDGCRASGRFGDEIELRFERGIFTVLGPQVVSVALNDRNDIV